MKKKLLFVAAIVAASATFAQDGMTSKKGFVILPEAGDWSISADATPFIEMGLNLTNALNATGVDKTMGSDLEYVKGFNQIIVGKYFIDANTAYRVKVGINTGKSSNKVYGINPLTPNNTADDVENILLETNKSGNYDWFLSGGKEYRRGHNRLQGIYGWEAFLNFNGSSAKNTYEIEWNKSAEDSNYVSAGDFRVLSSKSGMSLNIGVRGFVGIEYFVLPKISLGAEFGWGFAFLTPLKRGKVETEYWGKQAGSTATDNYSWTEEVEGPNSQSFYGFAVDKGNDALMGTSTNVTINFHF